MVKSIQYDSNRGCWRETGTFTVTATLTTVSFTNATEAEFPADITITGANTTDGIFVSPHLLTTGIVYKGARVSNVNTVSVLLRNSSTVVKNDSTAILYDYEIFHYS